MIRRYLVLLIFALWMGGFTFYTLIVIPTGGQVLGSERDVGFITQQVTIWLNWIGLLALLIFGWNLRLEGRGMLGFLMACSWLMMALTEAGVFLLHRLLDGLIDITAHKIHGRLDHFFDWHRAYMATASLQWLAALVYIWISLIFWRRSDRQQLIQPSHLQMQN